MQAVDVTNAVERRVSLRTFAALATFWMSAGAASEAGANGIEVGAKLLAEGLTAPLALAEPPDGSGRLFVLEQIGRLRVIDAEGQLLDAPFLDFRDRLDPTIEPGFDERGALAESRSVS